jgi:Gluconate 2-dehydrogenase subunit 3
MTITRREIIQQVAVLLGGTALAGGDRVLAFSFEEDALAPAMTQGVGAFTVADVALFDEIAETILPETSTPGAKAAKTGAFMALMVTDVYTLELQQVFGEGLRSIDEECRRAHGTTFMQATPAQRLSVVEALDREQQRVMDARRATPSSRAPVPESTATEPPHYFRMMKELTLLGYFTSEIGCTKALRYIESPGRFDPCAPHAPGDRAWAGHA